MPEWLGRYIPEGLRVGPGYSAAKTTITGSSNAPVPVIARQNKGPWLRFTSREQFLQTSGLDPKAYSVRITKARKKGQRTATYYDWDIYIQPKTQKEHSDD